MAVISSASLRGRRICPICGADHATCGGPSSSIPVDSNIVEANMAEPGPRGKYVDAKGNVFNATPEHAEKMRLQPVGQPFIVQSTAADVKQADQVANKMVAGPSENKAGNAAGGADGSSAVPPSAPEIFSSAQLASLQAYGLDSADKIAAASDEDLLAVDGIGPKTVEDYRAWQAERKAAAEDA